MSYLDDLNKNIELAEEHLRNAEYALETGRFTAYDFAINSADAGIKCIKFCVKCVKRKKTKLGPHKVFKCSGGCIRPCSFNRFTTLNKRLWYLMHLTRRNDPRYR